MDWKTSRIIDSNGQKYRVGWDEHGYFSIEMGELFEGQFHPAKDEPIHGFPPSAVDDLIDAIEEGR